jgi:WD40 repeat protein
MQGECFRYAEPKVSKPQPITQIRFSKDNPKWLFAGSEDRYVYLYDMGELNDTEQDAATNLAKFVGLKKDPTAINVNKNNLIVGCSDGAIVIYNLSNIPTVEEAKKSAHLVNISISHKFTSLHNTYIDDIIPYSPQYHQDSLVNTFFTRGAKDRICLWSVDNLDLPIQKKTTTKRNSKKSETTIRKELIPTTLSELKWTHYVECVRFSLINDEDETLLLTGSGAGDINIYKLQEDKSLKLISIFKHEQSREAIRKVVLSKDKKYLVGVNEINLAFIWKLK